MPPAADEEAGQGDDPGVRYQVIVGAEAGRGGRPWGPSVPHPGCWGGGPHLWVVGASRAPFIPDKRAKAGNRYRRASPPFEYGGHGTAWLSESAGRRSDYPGGFELARLRWPRRQPPRATAGSFEGSAEMGRRGADPDNGSGGRLARAWRWLQSSGFGATTRSTASAVRPEQRAVRAGRPHPGRLLENQPPHPADRRWPGSVDAAAPASAACQPDSCSRDEPHPRRPCPQRAPSSGSQRSPTVNTGQTEWSLSCISTRRWAVGQCFPSSR
jgi:hypothetical protein